MKISTPSIYKKVIQLEKKGYITSCLKRDGKMPEKAVYSLTPSGKKEFEKLMLEISCKPINIFLDFNAVIVNLDSMPEKNQQEYLNNIESNIKLLKMYLEDNLNRKESAPDVPAIGKSVLQQQYVLAQTIEKWIKSLTDTN
ncbi:DNA-binding PadR family transcriptional regulator [Aequitasia blattaphilus]